MADISNFLDDSDTDESQTSDIEITDIATNTINEEQTNIHLMMLDNVPTDTIIRAEDLFAKQADIDKKQKQHLPCARVEHQTLLSFDLGHLCCYDPVSINIDQLFQHKKQQSNQQSQPESNQPQKLTQTQYEIRKLKEKYLYDMTRNNVQAMVNKLYSFQSIKTGPNDDPGIVVKLPPTRLKLPRCKPIPETKPLTRWEKFAARKGIRTSKKTKDLLQWDENSKTWKKKYGYNKANDNSKDAIFVHKDNDFCMQDPWLKMEKQKKKRIAINKENQMRNLQEALGDRIGGTLDLQSAINYNKNKNKKKIGNRAIKEMGKEKKKKFGHLNVALNVAQHSTGSMGKFDELNKNEPKPKLKKNRKKSVGYMQTNENTKVHQFRFGKNSFSNKERNRQKEILFNIFGKEQKDAFNVEKATKHEQFVIEKKRAKSNRNRSRRKK